MRLLLPTVVTPVPFCLPVRRAFSIHHAARYRSNTRAQIAAERPADVPLRNYEIRYPYIQIRGDDNRLGPPEQTNSVLKRLDIARYDLVLIVPPRRDPSAKGPEYPICTIVDRRARAAAQAEKEGSKYGKKKKKEPKVVEKELEVNWAIAPHDLDIRMKQLRTFLSKGYRVQVRLLVPKKRDKRRATPDEAETVFQNVLENIAKVPGTSHYKKMEGEVGKMVLMYLQGSKEEASSSAPAETASEKAPMLSETATVEVTEEATVKEAGP